MDGPVGPLRLGLRRYRSKGWTGGTGRGNQSGGTVHSNQPGVAPLDAVQILHRQLQTQANHAGNLTDAGGEAPAQLVQQLHNFLWD